MGKVFKYLGRSIIPIMIIIVMLVVQAMADLALPEYMSNIVNIGIQRKGIESLVPEEMTAGSADTAGFMMTSDEKALFSQGYEAAEKDGKAVYVLANPSDELDELMKKTICVLGVMANLSESGGDYSDYMPGMDDISFDADGSIIEQVYGLLKEKLGDTVTEQMGVSFLEGEYSELGINKSTSYILSIGIRMLGVALVIALSTVVVTLLASRVAATTARDMRKDVFQKVICFSSEEFNGFSTASLITRCTNDIQQVQILIVMLLRMVLYAPIIGIGALFKVFEFGSMLWIIGVAVLAIMTLIIILMIVAMPRFKILQKLVDRLNLVSREILSGLPVIRAFGREKYEEERFDKANTELTKTNLFVNRVMAFMFPLMMLILNGTSLLIVWIGAGAVENSQMQVGDILAFIQYAMQIIFSFLMLSMLSILLPRALISAGRISEVLKTDLSIRDAARTENFPAVEKGTVEFRNVSFKYPNAEECVLNNISFKVNQGETLAIIGSTGCGKSTLVNLIPRFYDVTDGEILVDGMDVRRVRLSELRDKLGYVPQKGVLFTGTIATNIGYGIGGADDFDERIKFAAKIAQADGFIEEKSSGYESEISQGGTNVSGGQRQRLAIARAIAKNPEIYIFDDSFSALDFKTDSALRKALGEIKDSTKIIVAQRISTVLNADKILVLEDGRIIGEGTHAELIKSCPAYVQIAESQLSKEEIGE